MSLASKIVLVTGANGDIGRAIVLDLADKGATVVAAGRSAAELEACFSGFDNVFPECFDILVDDQVQSAMQDILRKYGRLDGLINNAGRMSNQRFGLITKEEIEDVFAVNVTGLLLLTQYAVRLMRKGGSVVNISSIVAQRGNPGQATYSASKGAVLSLTRSLAKELGPRNIRVNAIAPGLIDTRIVHETGEEGLKARSGGICMGRIGQPRDVAQCCSFLISDASAYISGEVIGVNGCSVL